jgi:site-specific recombinase XerD
MWIVQSKELIYYASQFFFTPKLAGEIIVELKKKTKTECTKASMNLVHCNIAGATQTIFDISDGELLKSKPFLGQSESSQYTHSPPIYGYIYPKNNSDSNPRGVGITPGIRRNDTMNIESPVEYMGLQNNKTYSNEELKKYKEVQTCLNNINESSQSAYLRAIQLFCGFAGMNPTELILKKDQESNKSYDSNSNEIKNLVLKFRTYLEQKGYAPKTIQSYDGSIRGFFTSVLGKSAMEGVKNYKHGSIILNKDFVPQLNELKQMLDVVNLDEKFRILFIAQTGMRISDALKLTLGDIERELDLENIPLAITYTPEKDRDAIGERITFLASDGVQILREYLEYRKRLGEVLTSESPLLVGRTKRGSKAVSRQKFNRSLSSAYKKAGFNGNGKYGRFRAHSLRKFFITQLTNHGVQDKIVDFFVCHKISEVDRVYWERRVEELRRIYSEHQHFLNPLNQEPEYSLNDFKDLKEEVLELRKQLKEVKESKVNKDNGGDAKIVTTQEEILEYAKQGYIPFPLSNDSWLMKKQT